mgnify:CR=1 FL=1
MRHLLIPLALTVLLVGCSKSPEEKQKRLYSDAAEALDAFKFEEAQAIGQQFVQVDPTSPDRKSVV